ncbi:hypothetical protein NM688_g4836 [Phlebia brevispora]|uniref:Uncharacterized protein n=1 Tax=Phlebia brevispora TaxID=194682 RepID=A0ACC1T1T9_9APHY|nr:hypothetical protein NM688_g4836 [Phlebia brevispora]
MPREVRTTRLPDMDPALRPGYVAGMKFHQDFLRNATDEQFNGIMDTLKHSKGTMMMETLRDVGWDKDVDLAFVYALDHTDFFARPWENQLSKVEAHKRMDEWNKAVDEYIEVKGDKRPRFDIELKAKIGADGGPLYRHCEAEGCTKVEQRDVEKMKCCSGCKKIFYCSEACQTNDWKEHKRYCKSKSHRVQQLDSQSIMEKLVAGVQVMNGMMFGQSGGLTMPGGLLELD